MTVNFERLQKIKRIVKCLEEDGRMSLSEISKRTSIPISTVFDYFKLIRDLYSFKIHRDYPPYCESCDDKESCHFVLSNNYLNCEKRATIRLKKDGENGRKS